jgi:RHS repeat-associated protein
MLYLYDAQGQRVGKQQANTLEDYVYDPQGRITSVYQNSNLLRAELYTPQGRHIATWNPGVSGGPLFFNHADWLGTERVRTDSTGTAREWCTDTPYRMNLACAGQSDSSPMHFTGKQRDYESGLDNFGARYFGGGNSLGRFMTPDPLGGKRTDPQTLNKYSYVRNNPLSLIDPTGLYIVNCTTGSAKDQKNCNKAADRFENQREKDLKSKDVKVRDAAKAWGDHGIDNHVNVTFKSQQQVDVDARTQPGYKTEAFVTPSATSDHEPNINAEFSEDLGGKDLAQTIAHEGSHIEDDMNFLKSYDAATGQYNWALNFTHFDTEFQAFEAGSMVKSYDMFPSGPKGYQQLTNYIYQAYPNADKLVFLPSFYPQGNPPQ